MRFGRTVKVAPHDHSIEHNHVRGHPTGLPDDFLSEGSPLDIDPFYDPFEDPFRFIPVGGRDIADIGARGRPTPVGSPGATVDITASPIPGELGTSGTGALVGAGTPDFPRGRGPVGGFEPRILEQWRIQGAQDLLCTQWDRTVWPINSGPHPITDTHPNCRCVRVPYAESRTLARLRSLQSARRLAI